MNILIDSQTIYTPEINRGIGVYFLHLVEHILSNNFKHDFYILVHTKDDLKIFSKFAQQNLIPITTDDFDLFFSNDAVFNETTTTTYSNLIHTIIKNFNIDAYWSPNPLMMNVWLPVNTNNNVKFISTVYDLIPKALPELYINKWRPEEVKYYEFKLKTLANYDQIICISNSTLRDYKKFVGHQKNQALSVLTCGIESEFNQQKFPVKNVEKFILFVGGFDPRKNMEFAVEAFSKLTKLYDTYKQYKFIIVCSANSDEKERLNAIAAKYSVKRNLILTGKISKFELINLYKHCSAFFFPSLYEGFGFPILEALACGAPIATSNTSSLKEFNAKFVHFFNPSSIEDAVETLNTACSQGRNQSLSNQRVKYAQKFNWNNVAQDFLYILEPKPKIKTQKNAKIAWVSPFPPELSGISNYSAKLIPEMSKYVQVDLITDQIDLNIENKHQYQIRDFRYLQKNFSSYKEVFYNIGNNPIHKSTYKFAIQNPGTVILHDLYIQPFLEHSFLRSENSKERQLFYDVFVNNYGYRLKEIQNKTTHGIPSDLWKYMCSDELVRNTKRTIVHSRWAKRQFSDNLPVEVIPHRTEVLRSPPLDEINSFKRLHNIQDSNIVFSVLGFLNKNKQLDGVYKSIKILRSKGYPILLLFGGELSEEICLDKNLIRDLKNEFWIKITGHLDDNSYKQALFSSDLIVNLRYPSMGETSGILIEAISGNIPILIINQNQYSELADDNIFRISADKIGHISLADKLENILLLVLEKSKKKGKRSRLAESLLPKNIVPYYLQHL